MRRRRAQTSFHAPFRRRGPRPPWTRRQSQALAFWCAAFLLLTGGFHLFAPAVDDYRSSLRAMRSDCRITQVIDGDTVDLFCPERGMVRARLVGYDAPELYSPMCAEELYAAQRSRDLLQTWARHAYPTEVAFLGTDRYGRALVDMRLGGTRVATAMEESGGGRRYFGLARSGWC